MQNRHSRVASTLLLVLAIIFGPTALRADVTGSILGVVHDRSQAVVAGARIVATNVQTNFKQETVSAADGSYRILALPAGTYKVTVTAPGFQQYTATDVDLKVNDQLRVDVTLDVGSVKEKVEISVNGQRETANAFLVNGGDVSEGRNLGAGLVPNLDSIEEFRLITNSFDAEYGKFSGAVMNAITKSGTNGFHGDVFEFLRNDKFDANKFFDNQAPPGPDGKAPRAELRRNQFGYAIGGPFWKNRLFWFTDYQGTRQVRGASTGLVQLPTLDQRQGIFSPSDLSGAVDGPYWAQVLSQRLGYTVSNQEPYSSPTCTSTNDCVFPGGVITNRAWSKPTT